MPITPTYPGVYIVEIPSGVRTITGVATSITAFIGRARRGPINDPITINSWADFERLFGGLWGKSPMSYAVRDFYVNEGSQAIIVRLHNGAEAATIILESGGSPPNSPLVLEAANPGAWGAQLSAHVDYATKDANNNRLFNLAIYEKDERTGQILNTEKFLNISVDSDDPLYIPRVLEETSGLVRVKKDSHDKYQVLQVRPLCTFKTEMPVASPPNLVEDPVPANGGNDGSLLSDSQFVGVGMEDKKEGLYALQKADLFNLLCIPPYMTENGFNPLSPPEPEPKPTDISTALIASAATYCKKRRAMLIVDPHSKWTDKDKAKKNFTAVNDAYPGITGSVSNYAALYFPRLRQRNILRNNQIEEFVPCGAVAGVFARTDAQRGVWKAPAGQDAPLLGVPQLSVPLTDDENGELNQLGINCLRSFPVYGRIVWGSRTLEGADRLASEWKYIPVRRTALFIEESLYRGTKWVVFEPNDEPLWAQIRLNIGAFMHDLFTQGAFQGTTPRDAYFVKCDKETTTQNDINKGIVNIVVGFAPLKPAEFVIITIQQIAGQIRT